MASRSLAGECKAREPKIFLLRYGLPDVRAEGILGLRLRAWCRNVEGQIVKPVMRLITVSGDAPIC